MFKATTRNITVCADPMYLEDQSRPEAGQYLWAYKIRIENHSGQRIQLINRHWEITDGRGRREEVKGAGVVGEQPVLQPGEAFEYTSGCPLSTPTGFMAGNYEMVDEKGETFRIEIPAFPLDLPEVTRTRH